MIHNGLTGVRTYIAEQRGRGKRILFFDDYALPEGKYPTGCLLIEHPDLKLIPTFNAVPALANLWEKQSAFFFEKLGLYSSFDGFYKKMLLFYQKDEHPELAKLLERLILFRDNPLSQLCTGRDIEIPKSDRVGLFGLTYVERKIMAASVLSCLITDTKIYDEIYIWKDHVDNNRFMNIALFLGAAQKTGTKLILLSPEVAPAKEKNFLAKFWNKL